MDREDEYGNNVLKWEWAQERGRRADCGAGSLAAHRGMAGCFTRKYQPPCGM